jgi:hypothetical protein
VTPIYAEWKGKREGLCRFRLRRRKPPREVVELRGNRAWRESTSRQRDPKKFRFTILQRVSPDMEQAEVIAVENSWKERLHTREPFGER